MPNNDVHEANRKYWDAAAPEWQKLDEADWRKCAQQPSLAFEGKAVETITQYIGELRGKQVCVIGSGDNYAAFALAGLGAIVTSVDISDERLKIAGNRAGVLGLHVRFVRCDAANMVSVPEAAYDLVCSTNGFFVWIADLPGVFSEVDRILKPGGHYVFYDIHPFQRPWKDHTAIEMARPYWNTGPFVSEESGHMTHEFHWTVSDIVNSLLTSGLLLRRMAETPAKNSRFWQGMSYGTGTDDTLQDWRRNPRAGLPVWLTVVAQKPASELMSGRSDRLVKE